MSLAIIMSLLEQAPRFDAAGAEALARDLYGLEGTAAPLDSERDQNFLIAQHDGARHVLKIANAAESPAFLDAQNQAMAHAASRGALCPTVVPARDGDLVATGRALDGTAHAVRLITWLPGVPLGRVPHPAALLVEVGRRLGQLDAALADFDHPAIHRDFHWDIERASAAVSAHGPLVEEAGLRRLVEATTATAISALDAVAPALARAAIHNDANDYNVLITREAPGHDRVSGFIDFGDMIHGLRVADPAIALAYVMLGSADPLAAARHFVRGYHKGCPLTEPEVAVLFDLALLRLCQSVALAAWQTAMRPSDQYLAISQGPIAGLLPRLAAVPRRVAEAALRQACGLDPVPSAARVHAWIGRCAPSPVLDLQPGGTAVLDLSVASPQLSGDPAGNAEPRLSDRLASVMDERRATVGVGRYGEPRLLYTSALFAGEADGAERRTIHLGVDLFAPAGTPVHAPLAGVVTMAADNQAPLDYGPLVILEHRTAEGDQFHTLYGHLTRASLEGMTPGRAIAAGEAFAAIGDREVNGGWPPHLHLQVIVDLLGLGTDFPGVCRASERALWQACSPSPNLLLHIPDADYPPEQLDAPRALASRWARVGPSVRVGYRQPVLAARGWMQYLFDRSGRQYLDAYNNVPHVGHSHPHVVEAVASQLRVLNTNTRYLHDTLAAYATRLTATLPLPLRVCYFVNSGTEANELALRLARAHTGRQDVMVLDAAYHGHSTTMIDLSPYKFNGPGGQGARPWVHVAALPDVYRGPFRRADAGQKYAHDVGVMLGNLGPGRLAAFLAETCPSVAGQILLPPGYLSLVYEHVRAAGGVCIADEVQTAYGRMGSGFYAFESHGVIPDIVVLGKPIGNGYPLGAVVTTPEIAATFDNGMEFFSTFGGSTASCAAGLAVLDVVEGEELRAHAARVGASLGAGLRGLHRRHALVGDVRGSGLFWGVELVTDRATLEPAAAAASYVVNRLREEGILIGTDGPLHNVLKIRPPMPFDDADAARLIDTLDRVFGEIGP